MSAALPQLAIAKAAFSATLLRPDPTAPSPCLRDDIEKFHALLAAAVIQCSPANVQKCKRWLVQHLVSSATRSAAWGKYLTALTNSFNSDDTAREQQQTRGSRIPSARRRRLHVLYVLNDVLHNAKFRAGDDTFAAKLESFLPALVQSVATFKDAPKHAKKLERLLDLWDEKGYFAPGVVSKLRDSVKSGMLSASEDADVATHNHKGPSTSSNGTSASKAAAREAPWIMPATHGDINTPWYDLPASNWLPYMEPNSSRPMNPSMIKPLQLAQGPADKTLVEEVKKLLLHVDRIYSGKGSLQDVDAGPIALDIDQMGERVELDEISGEILDGDTYYGWSRAFCQQMKQRRRNKGGYGQGDGEHRGRSSSVGSRSRSSSRQSRSRDRSTSTRGSSRPAFKRRRLSTTSRSRSRSRSHSRSRGRYRGSRSRRSSTRSRSPPRGESREFRQTGNGESRSRSPGYAPVPPPAAHRAPPPPFNMSGQPNLPFPQSYPPVPLPPLPPHQQQHPFGGFPPPPPLPPPPDGYQGPWPPPPPPPPSMTAGSYQLPLQGWYPVPPLNSAAPWLAGWPQGVPPPPPPSVLQQQQQYENQQFNRGGGNDSYRGSGRGRGGGYGRDSRW